MEVREAEKSEESLDQRERRKQAGAIEVVYSFEEALRRDREAAWAMTPNERMALLEVLRQQWRLKDEPEPAFPGVLEVSRSS